MIRRIKEERKYEMRGLGGSNWFYGKAVLDAIPLSASESECSASHVSRCFRRATEDKAHAAIGGVLSLGAGEGQSWPEAERCSNEEPLLVVASGRPGASAGVFGASFHCKVPGDWEWLAI